MNRENSTPLPRCDGCPYNRRIGKKPACLALMRFRSPCFVRDLADKHERAGLEKWEWTDRVKKSS